MCLRWQGWRIGYHWNPSRLPSCSYQRNYLRKLSWWLLLQGKTQSGDQIYINFLCSTIARVAWLLRIPFWLEYHHTHMLIGLRFWDFIFCRNISPPLLFGMMDEKWERWGEERVVMRSMDNVKFGPKMMLSPLNLMHLKRSNVYANLVFLPALSHRVQIWTAPSMWKDIFRPLAWSCLETGMH